MDCLTEEQVDGGVGLPTLIVICSKWLYWKAHLPYQLRFLNGSLKRQPNTVFCSIKDSGHVNFSDPCLWMHPKAMQYTHQAGKIDRNRFLSVCGTVNSVFMEKELNDAHVSFADLQNALDISDRDTLSDVSKFDPAKEWKSRRPSIDQETRVRGDKGKIDTGVSSMSIHPHINEEGDIMVSDNETSNGNGNGSNGNGSDSIGSGKETEAGVAEGVRQRKANL
eukprot:GDKI01015998.1.p1 GENE.GDKI01015998.1~~GDKI01015998.1.p1  ORF type:complete len:222 (+),score=64.34 GDKI01015998.1:152-817(+)